MPVENPGIVVQTLDRALKIIELLALHGEGMGVTAIGNQVGLHKSTVHRLLSHLVSQGYVEKDETGPVYTLGLKFIELASLRLNQVELKTEAGPYLRRLAAALDQPVHLAILADTDAVYIEKIDPQAHLRMYSQIGKRIPVFCSALGKCLVSDWTAADLATLADKLTYQAFTPKTRTTPQAFLADVGTTRERGWALDDEEHEPGIRCIGAPVRDFTGKIVAAVSASGSPKVIRPESDAQVSVQVVQAAEAISRRLGWLET
jgi:IclR family transcriptional regulator, KDG regulon repressor